MKNTFLLVWNIVLTAVVGYLLFQITGNKHSIDVQGKINDSTGTDSSGALRIAYLNIDTLQNNYTLFVDKRKELEAKQKQIEALLDKKTKDLQAEYIAAQKSAQYMTSDQLKETDQKLVAKQQEIEKLQNELSDDFQNQLDEFNKQLKDSLDSFIKDYNAEKKYTYVLSMSEGGFILFAETAHDITTDAINGMNARLKK